MGVTGAEGRGKQSRSHTLRWTDRQVDVKDGGAVCVCVCVCVRGEQVASQ